MWPAITMAQNNSMNNAMQKSIGADAACSKKTARRAIVMASLTVNVKDGCQNKVMEASHMSGVLRHEKDHHVILPPTNHLSTFNLPSPLIVYLMSSAQRHLCESCGKLFLVVTCLMASVVRCHTCGQHSMQLEK
jgi:hypothetical protein